MVEELAELGPAVRLSVDAGAASVVAAFIGPDNTPRTIVTIDDIRVEPIDPAALLRMAVSRAQGYLNGATVVGLVLVQSSPQSTGLVNALAYAARDAGFPANAVTFVPALTAAAAFCGPTLGIRPERLFAVADIGATHCAMGLFQFGSDGGFSALVTHSVAVGGDDIDAAIARWAVASLPAPPHPDAGGTSEFQRNVRQAKYRLADADEAQIPVRANGQNESRALTQPALAEVIVPLTRQISDLAHSVLRHAPASVDVIYLVGGSSQVEAMRRAFMEIGEVVAMAEPSIVAAHGALTMPVSPASDSGFTALPPVALATQPLPARPMAPIVPKSRRPLVISAVAAVVAVAVAAAIVLLITGHSTTGAADGGQAPTVRSTIDLTDHSDLADSTARMALDPENHTAYVIRSAGSVLVLDTRGNTITHTIPITRRADGIAVDPATHTAFVTAHPPSNGGGTLTFIDTRSASVTGVSQLSIDPAGVAVDRPRHSAYVYGSGPTAVIDTATHTTVGNADVKMVFGIDFDPSGSTGYAAEDFGTVRFDTAGGSVTQLAGPNAPGTYTTGIGLDPVANILVTTVEHGPNPTDPATVMMIDPASGTVEHTVELSGGAKDLALDSRTHSALVTSGDMNCQLLRIDLRTGKINGTVPIGSFPSTVAADSTTGTVYTLGQYGLITVFGQ